MSDRPLSERLAEIMRLPIPGGSADTLAEAVELAKRVEAASVVDLEWSTFNRGLFVGDTAEDAYAYEQAMAGKRVALVEVPGE